MSEYRVSVWTTSSFYDDPDLEIVVCDATDAREAMGVQSLALTLTEPKRSWPPRWWAPPGAPLRTRHPKKGHTAMSDYLVSVWVISSPSEEDPDAQIVVTDATTAREAMADGCAVLRIDPEEAEEVMATHVGAPLPTRYPKKGKAPMSPDYSVILTTQHAPWMPLEGLIQQWASFGHEATTVEMSKAVSCAFAAFSHEQEALASYHLALQEDAPWLAAHPSLLSGYELALDEVEQGAKAWTRAAYVLDHAVHSQHDPAHARRLAALVLEALTQCQRLSCIAHVVRAEQHRHYQQRVTQREARP